jgi:hypothetical protein
MKCYFSSATAVQLQSKSKNVEKAESKSSFWRAGQKLATQIRAEARRNARFWCTIAIGLSTFCTKRTSKLIVLFVCPTMAQSAFRVEVESALGFNPQLTAADEVRTISRPSLRHRSTDSHTYSPYSADDASLSGREWFARSLHNRSLLLGGLESFVGRLHCFCGQRHLAVSRLSLMCSSFTQSIALTGTLSLAPSSAVSLLLHPEGNSHQCPCFSGRRELPKCASWVRRTCTSVQWP